VACLAYPEAFYLLLFVILSLQILFSNSTLYLPDIEADRFLELLSRYWLERKQPKQVEKSLKKSFVHLVNTSLIVYY
jgi:hypothetical protein